MDKFLTHAWFKPSAVAHGETPRPHYYPDLSVGNNYQLWIMNYELPTFRSRSWGFPKTALLSEFIRRQ